METIVQQRQQRLLLELLIISGDVAVAHDTTGTIHRRTLEEWMAKGLSDEQAVRRCLRQGDDH